MNRKLFVLGILLVILLGVYLDKCVYDTMYLYTLSLTVGYLTLCILMYSSAIRTILTSIAAGLIVLAFTAIIFTTWFTLCFVMFKNIYEYL
mgnify:CR=1 FL=1